VSVPTTSFRGFINAVDPTAAELRSWAYQPDSVALEDMPHYWDLLVAGDRLITTIFALAMDANCPARRFALHCLYIYAADGIRTDFSAHPKRRLHKLVRRAEAEGDELMKNWAYNVRVLLARPMMFDFHDWCEGGLVRSGRRLR
jgi:hypothetical protein